MSVQRPQFMVSWIHRCGKAEMQYEGTAEKSLLPRGRQEQKDRKGGPGTRLSSKNATTVAFLGTLSKPHFLASIAHK